MKGSIALDFPRGRARRLALAGGTLGFLGLGGWIALALVRASGAQGLLALALLVTTMPIALALSIALPPWILGRRAPRDARVEWDRDAIVERDGEAIRTAIAWRDARVRSEGGVVQITDAAGRAITVAEHAATPRWLSRRRASAGASELATLAAGIVDRDPGPPIEPDERDARRPVTGPQVVLATVALAVIGVPSFAIGIPALAPPFAALCVALLCALPALRPLHELAALIGESRRFDRADEATIEDPDPTTPLVRRSDGTWVRIDLSRAKHADALLGTRDDARVRVVLPPSGWVAAPTRATASTQAVAVDGIETPAERAARGELVRAVVIELAARSVAILFWGAMSLSPLWIGE